VAAGGGVIKREKIGPIETEYAVNGTTRADYPAIAAALAGLVRRPSAYSGSSVRG